jgi:hypothetical protein
MRRIAANIGAAGFFCFLAIALLPILSSRPPIYPYVGMVLCAILFLMFDRTRARYIAGVCLLLALVAGINLYQRNARHDARLMERVRQEAIQLTR